jgi:anhydro-N-acetylmuramic acid kinase
MDSKNNFKVIGLMSGTSLDGLDIAYCQFRQNERGWLYSIKKATTVRYPASWIEKLSTAQNLSGEQLIELDSAYGKFLGKVCDGFRRKNKLQVDFIASHGHTIFHQPKKGFTFQLGNGNALHAACGIPVIFDFRSLDVMLGGQGAPLVPAGDLHLFNAYDVCLNLGGIANLSMDIKGKRVAFDICFANMGLNYLMGKIGKEFDKGGAMSSDGIVLVPLLKELNKVYMSLHKRRPSLGREVFEQRIKPLLDTPGLRLKDKLRTFTASCVNEVALAILSFKQKPTVLCTGGGAFNSFFISQLLESCGDDATLILPDDEIIKFKEAMVFAFLGVLKVRGEVNCLQSVTGARKNSSSGTLVG